MGANQQQSGYQQPEMKVFAQNVCLEGPVLELATILIRDSGTWVCLQTGYLSLPLMKYISFSLMTNCYLKFLMHQLEASGYCCLTLVFSPLFIILFPIIQWMEEILHHQKDG